MLVDRDSIIEWVASLKVRKGQHVSYRHSYGSDATPFSLCFAVMVLALLDGIKELTARERDELADSIRAVQCGETGLFRIDGLPTAAHGHDETYVQWQLTTFCLSALRALGVCPKHRVHVLTEWRDPDRLSQWMNELDWHDPWCVGNLVMFLCIMHICDAEQYGAPEGIECVQHILDWHDQRQRPKSGFWGEGSKSDYLEGFGGAFHQFLIYFYLGRPILRSEKVVGRVLKLQQRDGLFTPRMGGDGCADYDAIDVLAKMAQRQARRSDEISQSLLRAYRALERLRHPCGGFVWTAPESIKWHDWIRHACMVGNLDNWVYVNRNLLSAWLRRGQPRMPQGWTGSGIPAGEADLFATFTRVVSIALIAQVCDIPERLLNLRFLQAPGLGWHGTPLATGV